MAETRADVGFITVLKKDGTDGGRMPLRSTLVLGRYVECEAQERRQEGFLAATLSSRRPLWHTHVARLTQTMYLQAQRVRHPRAARVDFSPSHATDGRRERTRDAREPQLGQPHAAERRRGRRGGSADSGQGQGASTAPARNHELIVAAHPDPSLNCFAGRS